MENYEVAILRYPFTERTEEPIMKEMDLYNPFGVDAQWERPRYLIVAHFKEHQ